MQQPTCFHLTTPVFVERKREVTMQRRNPLSHHLSPPFKIKIVWANPFTASGEARRVRVLYTVEDPVAGE